jgi:hypothetical protein
MFTMAIGLQNLRKELAVGGGMVVGEIAFSMFLILGFTLYNTIKGWTIVAHSVQENPRIMCLLSLGSYLVDLQSWVHG